jgi:hypothetical protein
VIGDGATNIKNVHQRKPNTGAVMINFYNIINFVCLFTVARLLLPAHEISVLEVHNVNTCPHILKGFYLPLQFYIWAYM